MKKIWGLEVGVVFLEKSTLWDSHCGSSSLLLCLWSSKKLCRAQLGTPISISIIQNQQEMQGRYSKIWSLSCVWWWACLPYWLKISKQHYNLNGNLVSHLNSCGDILVALRTRRHLPSSVPSSTTTWLISLEPISKQVEYWGPLGQKWQTVGETEFYKRGQNCHY
jgi:hypothetical protein